jgi:RNA polymerase sigma-70 factor (ECF subfamily)
VDLAALVTLAQSGDEEAFASLAITIGHRLHAISKRILRDTDRAEDATQQALLQIWRELPSLRDPGRFEAWCYRVLVRVCYAESRATRRWAPNVHLLSRNATSRDGDLDDVWDRDQLERGFRRLSIEHRTVVVLHYYLDQSPEEIGETLGVPVGTIRSRLFYAIRAMRANLEADERPRVREAVG